MKYLNRGGLPHVYPSQYPAEELKSYVDLYLQQEIQAEALTRDLPAFALFLDTIALCSGQEVRAYLLYTRHPPGAQGMRAAHRQLA